MRWCVCVFCHVVLVSTSFQFIGEQLLDDTVDGEHQLKRLQICQVSSSPTSCTPLTPPATAPAPALASPSSNTVSTSAIAPKR